MISHIDCCPISSEIINSATPKLPYTNTVDTAPPQLGLSCTAILLIWYHASYVLQDLSQHASVM